MVSKTLTGFKEFLLRGNLVELAVAVIMATTLRGGGEELHRPAARRHRQGRRRAGLLQSEPARHQLRGLPVRAADVPADRLRRLLLRDHPVQQVLRAPQEGRARRLPPPPRTCSRRSATCSRRRTSGRSRRFVPDGSALARTASAAVMGRPIRQQPTFVVRQRPVSHHWPGVRRQRTELGQQRGPHGRELSGTQAPPKLVPGRPRARIPRSAPRPPRHARTRRPPRSAISSATRGVPGSGRSRTGGPSNAYASAACQR